MKYVLKLRGDHEDEIISAGKPSDAKYTNQIACRGYQREVGYYINDKKCFGKKDRKTLYMVITRLKQGSSQGQESYCCPNCGSITTVGTLLNGCPHCQTSFLISDLFPKVTNFFFMKDLSISEKESKNMTRTWMMTGFCLGLILGFPNLLNDIREESGLFITLISYLAYGGLLAVIGYFGLSFRLMFRLVGESVRQAPMLPGQLWAMGKLKQFMKRYDPTFSFDFFAGKVQFLLKIFIFSEGGLQKYQQTHRLWLFY